MKKFILKRLQEHLDAVIAAGYDKERILGVFLYGSQNYGCGDEWSDIDSKVIILPTFEDFCLKTKLISREIHLDNGEHIDIKDIRLMRENFLKQNINYLEILFTEYCIVMPKWKDLWEELFIENREAVAAADKCRGVRSIVGQAKHTLAQGVDDKKLYNGMRLVYFLQSWLIDSAPYLECIHPMGEQHNNLMLLKTGKANLSDSEREELAADLRTSLQTFSDMADQYEPDSEARRILDEAVVTLLKESFNPTEEQIPAAAFVDQLTNLERRALGYIIKDIGKEGTIVVSKIVKDTSISRPVYNNLFEKMKLNKIADISNMGVKGMHIKFTHPAVFNLFKKDL